MRDEADNLLLERARAGDGRALEALLERHQAQIYRFGMKMCRDPEDAKDVLQDTLLAMARGVRDFRGASSISTWLYHDRAQLLHQEAAAQQVRARSRALARHRRGVGGLPSSPTPAGARTRRSPASRSSTRSSEAIAALEPMYREVLVLRDVEGLTAPEVAEVLGVSVQAVKSRLHRARLAVRERVAPLLGIPPAPARRRRTLPRRPHAVLAAPRGRDQRRGLRRDGAPPRRLRALPGRLRLAQAHARALPDEARGSGAGAVQASVQARAAQLPRRDRLNPFAPGGSHRSWRPRWRPCR